MRSHSDRGEGCAFVLGGHTMLVLGKEEQAVTNGSFDSPAYCLCIGLPTRLQCASRQRQCLCIIMSCHAKREAVFSLIVLQVPVDNHHGILEFVADVLKDLFHPTLS